MPTQVYPNSFGLQKIVIQNKFTIADKLKVIGKGSSNGIDTSHFDPTLISEQQKLQLRASLGFQPDDFVFVFVGRLVGDKGINELVTAFLSLKSQLTVYHSQSTSIKLLLVGSQEADLDPLPIETLREIEVNPSIRAVGFQREVRPYFTISDVLTFPSYREGFPNVVMQAASMQLNAIVSDINGCNEIISHGKNGWIVSPKNVEELRDRMLWCIQHKESSKAMGLKSRKLIQRGYERQFVWRELLKEYQGLLRD